MNASRPSSASNTNPSVQPALSRLKQAEVDLLAVVCAESHPDNAVLLEAQAFLWEAISMLSRVATTETEQSRNVDVAR
jgi:hypothetical protein